MCNVYISDFESGEVDGGGEVHLICFYAAPVHPIFHPPFSAKEMESLLGNLQIFRLKALFFLQIYPLLNLSHSFFKLFVWFRVLASYEQVFKN